MEKEMEKAKNLVKYCDSVYKTQRRKTRTVHCGDVPIGTTSITTYIDTCTYLTETFTPCNLPIGTTYGLHTLPHTYFTKGDYARAPNQLFAALQTSWSPIPGMCVCVCVCVFYVGRDGMAWVGNEVTGCEHAGRGLHACHMRKRIHACHMRRRIHACHMRRRIHVQSLVQIP